MHIEFDGTSSARGRNGWFRAVRSYVSGYCSYRVHQQEKLPTVLIDVESKQMPSHSPIALELSLDDAQKLSDAILKAIEDAKLDAERVEARYGNTVHSEVARLIDDGMDASAALAFCNID